MIVRSAAVSVRHVSSARWARMFATVSVLVLLVSLAWEPAGPMVNAAMLGLVLCVFLDTIWSIGKFERALTIDVNPATLTIRDGDAVVRAVSRSQVRSAIAMRRHVKGAAVEVVEIELPGSMGGPGDVVSVRTMNGIESDALVSALGFGRGERRITIDVASSTRRLLHAFLLFPAFVLTNLALGALVSLMDAGSVAALVGPAAFALFYAFFSLLKLFFRAPHLVVGDDGLTVEKVFRRRFVPRAAMASIEDRGRALRPRIILVDGSEVPLPFARNGIDNDRVRGVVAALEARAPAKKPFAPELARGARSVADLRADLRQRIESPGYRDAAASTETAGAVLRSADASLDERVTAAMALRIAGTPPEKIRVAAEPFADEATREALEAVATDDDARIERVLGRARR